MRIVNKNRLLTQKDVFKSVVCFKKLYTTNTTNKEKTDRKQKGSSHIQVDIIVYKSRVVQLSVSDQ